MRIALAQLNTIVGDINGNAAKIVEQIDLARDQRADLVVFHELATFGYPPKDILLRSDRVQENVAALEMIAGHCKNITAVVGCVLPDGEANGTGLINAAAVCADGQVVLRHAKNLLPTYDVFDETRYFTPSRQVTTFEAGPEGRKRRIGLTVCEDLWNDEQFEGRRVYGHDPVEEVVRAGAEIVINISASPYEVGKLEVRERLFSAQAREHGVIIATANQVGGNDDLVFDGASGVFDASGRVVARAKSFQEDLLLFDVDDPKSARVEVYPDPVASIRDALVLGTRDYMHKCGFRDAVIGLSGGIDSAVTAAIAVEALGPERVRGVAMPSRHSSDHSIEDARQLAENYGIRFDIVEIETHHRAMEDAMKPLFDGRQADVTEENIQARVRGNILMSLSNKFGSLLLTTGNKSELAVGYCTMYGDMCGGLAVLSDVPKTMVYTVARLINESAGRELIPDRSITKPPSAELRPDQVDQDSLPPYDVLDAILESYVEKMESVEQIAGRGFDRDLVAKIAKLVDRNEYKRKQAAVGLKVTSRAFGTGRRMPIAAKY